MSASSISNYFKSNKTGSAAATAANTKARRVSPTKSDILSQSSKDTPAAPADDFAEMLEDFDANPTFGPCIGIPRSVRWQNAERFGLDPPKEVLQAIHMTGSEHSYLDKYIL